MSLSPAAPGETSPRPAPVPRLSGLSVVFPCLNEEETLPWVLEEWRGACAEAAFAWELIVVDDGSTDRTAEVALRAARGGGVRLMSHPRNLGYGAAVRTGIAAARLSWTLIIDGDGQFDPADLMTFVALAGDYDVIVGYRGDRADGTMRRLNGHAWSWLMRHALGVPVRDVDCAFKLMRSSLVRDLPLTSDGAMVSAELLAHLAGTGARLAEVPVSHRPRLAGRATGAHLRVIVRAFRELREVRRSLR